MQPPSHIDRPSALLGGLTPSAFMRKHWQKKPLLVRQALPVVRPPATRAELFALAAQDAVESRLIVREGRGQDRWRLRHGPLPRRALPPVSKPAWTLLVQGLDLHVEAAHELLRRFDFIPQARLDDLMLSWASDGGGVGPHLDSYDVFLLQVQGRRRWRVGPPADTALVPGLPLKILAHFEPSEDWLLEPGDMLYLPPGWAHDGVADGECMTASIGFRAPDRDGLASELLARLSSVEPAEDARRVIYRDPSQAAAPNAGRIPEGLQKFAEAALARALKQPGALSCALGELLTEPKPLVWFEAAEAFDCRDGVRLHPASRMLYDDTHIFLNGESWRAAGRDATLMRRLADERQLAAHDLRRASEGAIETGSAIGPTADGCSPHDFGLEGGPMQDKELPDHTGAAPSPRQPATPVEGRAEFPAALLATLDECAQAGVQQLWWCDADFSDWPLGQPAVIEALTRWIDSKRQLTLIAARYDRFTAHFPRWVTWRRQWSHVVRCLAVHEELAGQVPSLALASGLVGVQLHDPERLRGRLYREASDLRRCKDLVDALSQRTSESFPVTTLGL